METKNVQEQLEMIKRNNHDEIMAYIAKNDFCDEAEIALTRRGNDEEIRAYSVSD